MGKPEIYRDHCAKQAARSAGAPMLARISAIGEQLSDGGDLSRFADQESFGITSTACEKAPTVIREVE
jgi:hypothetical protein